MRSQHHDQVPIFKFGSLSMRNLMFEAPHALPLALQTTMDAWALSLNQAAGLQHLETYPDRVMPVDQADVAIRAVALLVWFIVSYFIYVNACTGRLSNLRAVCTTIHAPMSPCLSYLSYLSMAIPRPIPSHTI